jgi:diguanylate cyclase (GGDEF)-like protein
LLQFGAGGVVGIVLAHGLSSWKGALGSAQRRAEEAQHDALTDVLTRLPNRRALDLALSREIAGARRGRSPFALLLFDIDHFKRLNDDLGHRAGDTALAGLAGLLQGALREEDVVGRWGGDEFVALAPGTDGGAAMALAERVRRAVAGYAWTGGDLTVSVGVTLYHPGDGAETMLARADRGLYRSKDGGRNRSTLEAE